jgi:hypothetical protein
LVFQLVAPSTHIASILQFSVGFIIVTADLGNDLFIVNLEGLLNFYCLVAFAAVSHVDSFKLLAHVQQSLIIFCYPSLEITVLSL